MTRKEWLEMKDYCAKTFAAKDAEIERLTIRVAGLEMHRDTGDKALTDFRSIMDAQKAEIERLRKGLEVFANPMNWKREWDDNFKIELIAWVLDRSYRNPAAFAREVLENKS